MTPEREGLRKRRLPGDLVWCCWQQAHLGPLSYLLLLARIAGEKKEAVRFCCPVDVVASFLDYALSRCYVGYLSHDSNAADGFSDPASGKDLGRV